MFSSSMLHAVPYKMRDVPTIHKRLFTSVCMSFNVVYVFSPGFFLDGDLQNQSKKNPFHRPPLIMDLIILQCLQHKLNL